MDNNALGVWMVVNPLRFDLAFLAAVIVTGVILGYRGARPLHVALTMALIPLLLWAIAEAVYVQGDWHELGVRYSAGLTIDFARYQLNSASLIFSAGVACAGFLGAWGGLARRAHA